MWVTSFKVQVLKRRACNLKKELNRTGATWLKGDETGSICASPLWKYHDLKLKGGNSQLVFEQYFPFNATFYQ